MKPNRSQLAIPGSNTSQKGKTFVKMSCENIIEEFGSGYTTLFDESSTPDKLLSLKEATPNEESWSLTPGSTPYEEEAKKIERR